MPFMIGLIGPTGAPVLLGDLDLLTTSPTSRTPKRGALHVAAAPDGGAASPAAPVRGIPRSSRPMRLGEERSP